MRVYVSGPYSAPDDEGRLRNTEAAMRAGLDLLKAGHDPFVPHLTHFLDVYAEEVLGARRPYREWMRLDLAFLPSCEAFLRLPGQSQGADEEEAEARTLGMPVFTDIRDIPGSV